MESKHVLPLKFCRVAALAGPGMTVSSGTQFKHGAVIMDGSRILMAKSNSSKSHPILGGQRSIFLHAESACIFHLGFDHCPGKTLYVARLMKGGEFGMSKPCDICQKYIKMCNFKRVYYTTDSGEMAVL